MDNRKKEIRFFDLSMFVLRTALGGIFIIYGGQKLFGMFGGLGISGTTKLLESLNMYNPHLAAMAWAYVELIGGIFLIFGIMTKWAAAACLVTTLFYMWGVSLPYGAFFPAGGAEYSYLLIASMIPLVLMGGGSWAVWDL